MAFRRPCLTEACPALSDPGRSRCPEHEAERAQHRNARKNALRQAAETGARAAVRRAVNRQGSGPCAKCRVVFPASGLQVDHVVALADGGADVLENLQVLCRDCHRRKTAEERRARRDRDR